MKALVNLSLLLALCNSLVAEEVLSEPLDRYISEYKKDQFNYDYKKNKAEGSKLRDSWIDPLNLSYSYSKNNSYGNEPVSKKAAIGMDQAIFQSGGIYFGIKYASASQEYADLSVDVQKRKLVKEAVSILMQIKQTDLRVKRQNLQIKNSEISLSQKEEQYLNGQLDSGFLDNAVIERNFVIQSLYDIETSKQRLISKFQAISDLRYGDASIPFLPELTQEQFLEHNIVLQMSDSEIEKTRYFKNVTIAKYLPRVSIQAGYNWDKSEDQKFGNTGAGFSGETDYYNYGFRATMPLDINTFNDIEASKLDYLKSRVAIEDKKRELIAIFEQVMQSIENFDKKKQLSIENKEIYERLLKNTRDLFSAGYKTEYDVGLLENSVAIAELDFQIFEIDKQLELLTLYEMYKND